MKTYIAACAFLFLSFNANASDWLPLPQSLKDLLPVARKNELPPAPAMSVGIPQNRIGPALEKSKDVIRIAPGKSQTIVLPREASSVIIGNPAHASVFLDNSRLLVVVPRAPGATSFTVLDNQGQTVLSQDILVSEKDDSTYVRVTRICEAAGGNAGNCLPTTTYYCPDNCVPVSVPGLEANAAMPTIPPVASMPSLPSVAGAATPEGQSVN